MSAPFRTPAATDLAGIAHARHLRRQLAQAAEHGVALLASLGLPRLVTADFVPLDAAAIGEAVEAAVAALDAMDGDPEAEPWLGWTPAGAIGGSDEREQDTADAEFDLGWPANHSQLHLGDNTPDGDLSALERHGRGFVRSGPDDAEEDDPLDDDRTAEDSAPQVWVSTRPRAGRMECARWRTTSPTWCRRRRGVGWR